MENKQNEDHHTGSDLESYDGQHWGPAMYEPATPLELRELAKEEWLPTAIAAGLCTPLWIAAWLLHRYGESGDLCGVGMFVIFLLTAYPIGMCIRCVALTAVWLFILPFRWSWRASKALVNVLRSAC